MPRTRIAIRAIAFHEAAHAVARLHVGEPAIALKITPTSGFTHGARKWHGRGEARMWKWLLVHFAGSYAQAFASRRSLWRTFKYSGKLDLAEAAPAVSWLVKHCYVRTRMEVLRRVHAATLAFLMFRWDAIDRVATGLLKDGKLSARRVRSLARI
jgi:hypothetical protein